MKLTHPSPSDQLLALVAMFLFVSVLGVMAFCMVVGFFTVCRWFV